MANANEVPPQSQKPIDDSGYFSPPWHRFFLKMHAQANKSNDVEAIISTTPSAGGGEGEGSSSNSSSIDPQTALHFNNVSPDLTKRLEELEAKLHSLAGAKDFTDRINDIELGAMFAKNTMPITIKKEIWLNAAGLKAPGAKPATEVDHGLGTAWQFTDAIEANQESISGRIKTPIDINRGVSLKGSIGWSADGISPGDCKWQVEYVWTAINEDTTASAQETLTGVSAASATSNGLVVTEIDGIDLPSTTDACLTFKITRLSADAEDTISDTVELTGVCLRYTSTELGVAA